MNKGKFITSSELQTLDFGFAWHNMQYNSYESNLEPEKGILTVKKEFNLNISKVKSVLLRSTALGVYESYVNGNVVEAQIDGINTQEYMKPGWTDYTDRVFEEEFDITEYCKKKNLFVAEVSRGWWSGRISMGFYGNKKTAYCAEIEVTYKDGTSEIIPTDDTWDATVCGPVLYSDIYNGIYYDARIPHASVKPSAHTWNKAEIFTDYTCKIEPFCGNKIVINDFHNPVSTVIHKGVKKNGTDYGEIKAVKKLLGYDCEYTLNKGEGMICDFGQNLVGTPTVFLKAKKGTRIDIYFAEMLNDSGDASRGNDGPKGSMYIKNYRSAFARITYICNGGNDIEVIDNIHTFYGFRYVEIRTSGKAEIYNVCAEEKGADLKRTGWFECDNSEINKFFSNVVYGMKGNYFSVPTDCPQRDERLGWTGDTQIFCGAASYLADIRDFMHKWLGDARASQNNEDGVYCDVIPRVFKGSVYGSFNGNAAWGDAGLIVPYKLYKFYNDVDIISEHYDSMEQYMNYIDKTFGINGPDKASYGDWLNYEITDNHYVSVCYYAYDAQIMAEFAKVLGKKDREEYYLNLFEKVKKHWAEKYLSNGKLTVDTQTGYLLALAFNLCEGELKEQFVRRLNDKIVSNDYTLSTGFVGTGVLNTTLSSVGLDKTAYSLLLQTKDPSWLYSVRQGATTVWERWNSYTLEKGFGDVGMNSFNHYAYGAVAEWMFGTICGIRPSNDNGFTDGFILAPVPDFRKDNEIPSGQKRINSASARFSSDNNMRVESKWFRENGKMIYQFEFLCDGDAEITLYAPKKINVNGLDVTADELNGKYENGKISFTLSSGKYTIITDDLI